MTRLILRARLAARELRWFLFPPATVTAVVPVLVPRCPDCGRLTTVGFRCQACQAFAQYRPSARDYEFGGTRVWSVPRVPLAFTDWVDTVRNCAIELLPQVVAADVAYCQRMKAIAA